MSFSVAKIARRTSASVSSTSESKSESTELLSGKMQLIHGPQRRKLPQKIQKEIPMAIPMDMSIDIPIDMPIFIKIFPFIDRDRALELKRKRNEEQRDAFRDIGSSCEQIE